MARRAGDLDAACKRIRADYGVKAEPVAADLTRQDEVERVARQVGGIDVLVNNAGAIKWGTLTEVDNDLFRVGWDLKVFGYISMCRAFYPALKERRGVIVNIIGAAGEWLYPEYVAGSTGNAALMAFTKTLGKGAAWEGVRVVAINPGPVMSDRFEEGLRIRAQKAFGDPDRWRDMINAPLGQVAEPEEIGYAAAFLASPRSASTAATVLTIDGGIGGPMSPKAAAS